MRLGLQAGYVSGLENGRIRLPAVETLRALARELDTTTIDLLHAAGYLTDGEAWFLSGGTDGGLRSALRKLAEADPETQDLAAELLATVIARREKRAG